MGLTIDRSDFTEQEFEHARYRLRANLEALALLLRREGFGRGEQTIGAELEVAIIDEHGQALPLNSQVLAESLDPQVQLEIDRFNLEYNVTPVPPHGTPFTAMELQLATALNELGQITARHGARIIPIGILPTLTESQLQSDAMTDMPRYTALAAGLRRIRQEDVRIRIDGEEPLETSFDGVSVEGANTSLQLHLRVDPDDFADTYNAAQLVTPLAVAVSSNSPLLLGHRLWDETRIALFKQSVDTRGGPSGEWRRAARVPFGHGWMRGGAYELFAEACHLYPILLPVCDEDDPLEIVRDGGVPELAELRLHQSTIWNWNRPVYDAAGDGHLRIELRALPAGPTPGDMMANAAFMIGLTVGLRPEVDRLLPAFPFRYAEYNFYRAAQRGLDAKLLWPATDGQSPEELPVVDLCRRYLTVADEGLDALGVDTCERRRLLGRIADRIDAGVTPARWLQQKLSEFDRGSRSEALAELVEAYLDEVRSGRPVSDWQ